MLRNSFVNLTGDFEKMTEISFETSTYYTGNITKNSLNLFVVSDFTVWVELDGSDIDVTNILTVDQLKSMKMDFINRYEMKLDELQAFDDEPEYDHEHALGVS